MVLGFTLYLVLGTITSLQRYIYIICYSILIHTHRHRDTFYNWQTYKTTFYIQFKTYPQSKLFGESNSKITKNIQLFNI